MDQVYGFIGQGILETHIHASCRPDEKANDQGSTFGGLFTHEIVKNEGVPKHNSELLPNQHN